MKNSFSFKRGMGIGGWLTNYKRFAVLPEDRRGITIGDMEHFREYITEWDAKNIKSMGFDHVRIGFDQIVLEESPYHYQEEIFSLLESFVKSCLSIGLNVVLNLHKAIGNYCDDLDGKVTLFYDNDLKSRVIALWAEIERRFSSYPTVAFELLNEVLDVPPELWNDFAGEVISALRKLNPTRTLIVGSVSWNYPTTLKDLRVLDDENVAYTFHCYEPFEFTHQRGVLQSNTLWYNRKLSYPSEDVARYAGYRELHGVQNFYEGVTAIDREYLKKTISGAIEFRKKHPDKVLWCGEFGTIRHADHASRVNYMRDAISLFDEYGIPYCVWNYLSTPNDGNRFSLVDDDTRAILSEDLLNALLGK